MPRRKTDPYRGCEWCGTALTRKRFSTGRLEDRSRFLARKFCDTACQQAAQNDPESVNRQTMYSRSRKHAKPNCERCGTTDRLHVHSRRRNLETLCVPPAGDRLRSGNASSRVRRSADVRARFRSSPWMRSAAGRCTWDGREFVHRCGIPGSGRRLAESGSVS
jgi:hypothetical protein